MGVVSGDRDALPDDLHQMFLEGLLQNNTHTNSLCLHNSECSTQYIIYVIMCIRVYVSV
jgi:hypothetical protein